MHDIYTILNSPLSQLKKLHYPSSTITTVSKTDQGAKLLNFQSGLWHVTQIPLEIFLQGKIIYK